MILQKEIYTHRDKYNVPPSTIDKDWILGHLLNAMYSFREVQENFVFKGGTCLKKCYFKDYRFSEDLDFTLLDATFAVDASFISKIIKQAEKTSGAKFYLLTVKEQIHNNIKQGYEVIIKFWGADHKVNQKPLPTKRWQTKIKLDISFSEELLLSAVMQKIIHPYSDSDKITNLVPVYDYSEIVAEKLRALVQRNRPRDIYDNWYFLHYTKHEDYESIKNLLVQKANTKKVDISKLENFVNDKKRMSNKRAWEDSLKHQIDEQKLPDFNNAYKAIEIFIEKILNL